MIRTPGGGAESARAGKVRVAVPTQSRSIAVLWIEEEEEEEEEEEIAEKRRRSEWGWMSLLGRRGGAEQPSP